MQSSKACQSTKYGNWIWSQAGIRLQMLKVKSGLFLLKLEIHSMTGRKVKFTWNDQNTNHFLENLKTVQLECEIFHASARQGEIWYLQKPNKILMPVFGRLRSTINVSYFFHMLCRNYKLLPMKKKTIILFMRKLRQTYSRYMHSVSFRL